MCTIPGIGNPWISHFPIKDRINHITTNLIKNKDTNDDKVLNAEELGVSDERFAKIDQNQDGQADRIELNIAHPMNRINHMTTNLIKNKDTNDDKVLNAEELGVSDERFAKIDQNQDGQADRKELNTYKMIGRHHYQPPSIEDSDVDMSV